MSADRAEARAQLRWGLLFLAGLLVPIVLGLVTFHQGRPLRLAATLLSLAVVDLPLVRAGATGRGAVGVVQPWRWSAYLGWLVIRLLILLPLALIEPAGKSQL